MRRPSVRALAVACRPRDRHVARPIATVDPLPDSHGRVSCLLGAARAPARPGIAGPWHCSAAPHLCFGRSPVWAARQRVPPAEAANGGRRLVWQLQRPRSAECSSPVCRQQQRGQHHREQAQRPGPAQRRAARLPPPIAAASPVRPAAGEFAYANGRLEEAANHALSPHPGSAALAVSPRDRDLTTLLRTLGRRDLESEAGMRFSEHRGAVRGAADRWQRTRTTMPCSFHGLELAEWPGIQHKPLWSCRYLASVIHLIRYIGGRSGRGLIPRLRFASGGGRSRPASLRSGPLRAAVLRLLVAAVCCLIVIHLRSPAGHDLAPVRAVRTSGPTLSLQDLSKLLLSYVQTATFARAAVCAAPVWMGGAAQRYCTQGARLVKTSHMCRAVLLPSRSIVGAVCCVMASPRAFPGSLSTCRH